MVRASRAIADRREGLARLSGQVQAARSRLSSADGEVTRLAAAVDDAAERSARAQSDFDALQGSVGDLDTSEVDLDEAHEAAATAVTAAHHRVDQLTDSIRELRTEETGLRARVDALTVGLGRKDGAGALLEAGEQLPGFVGSVATDLAVTPGYRGGHRCRARRDRRCRCGAQCFGRRGGASVAAQLRRRPRGHAHPGREVDARPAGVAVRAGQRALGE